MSVSTQTPVAHHRGRLRMPALTLVVAAILAAGGWAIANAVAGSSHPSAAAGSEASVLASLSPQNRSYVKAITELTPRQIAAAFGAGS
jgi:hypothetical protein